jgi:hypothetical protein
MSPPTLLGTGRPARLTRAIFPIPAATVILAVFRFGPVQPEFFGENGYDLSPVFVDDYTLVLRLALRGMRFAMKRIDSYGDESGIVSPQR